MHVGPEDMRSTSVADAGKIANPDKWPDTRMKTFWLISQSRRRKRFGRVFEVKSLGIYAARQSFRFSAPPLRSVLLGFFEIAVKLVDQIASVAFRDSCCSELFP